MVYIIYHGYFSFSIQQVAEDLARASDAVRIKPHTDYLLREGKRGVEAVDLKGDAPPSAILFFDKDIRLARALARDVPVFNAPEAIAAADDKLATWERLQRIVPMIETVPGPFHYRSSEPEEAFLKAVETRFGYPMVVKAAKGSFGEQVHLARNRADLLDVIQEMGSGDYLIQRFITEAAGRDKRVLVVDDHIVGAIARENADDFRANIELGGTARPAALTDEERAMALRAHRALGLTFSGIDLIESREGPLLVEVNSNMSYLGFQEATGISVSEKILHALARRGLL